jgi:DNA adenine methylase
MPSRSDFDSQPKMTPFLKWPGGKRWFVTNYSHLLPSAFNRYIEPFLGGGSVFFHLAPCCAILGDSNEALIAAYSGLREDWSEVEAQLEAHDENHCEAYYYLVRDSKPRQITKQAARLIYLNRTCFNGVYRVNGSGAFNVPMGTRDSILFETDDFKAVGDLLHRVKLRATDFEPLIAETKRGDFIFADPPYTVRHNVNGFVKYNEVLFSWSDQVRLAKVLAKARDAGAQILATNANHESVRELYESRGFFLKAISRFSSISADPDGRKHFEELVIMSNPPNEKV